MAQLSKDKFKYNSPKFLNSRHDSWKVCNISWKDVQMRLDRGVAFQVEGGGVITPLSENYFIYRALNGRSVTLPTKSKLNLITLLIDLESGKVENYVGERIGIFRRFFEWVKNLQFFSRRTT